MIEALQYDFIWRALSAGILVGGSASYYGVFVVQRKLSFLGSGLAHAAFGGVALGLLLGTEPLVVAVPFTVTVSLLINWIRLNTRLAGDTAVGVLFAVSVALGILFLSLRETGSSDAMMYLFGSILAVSTADLFVLVALAGTAIWTQRRLWGRWAYATFDPEMARADGLPLERDDYILSALVAVTTVVAIKMAGVLLVAAFLVIPAATARLVSDSFRQMTGISVLIGTGSVLMGLALALIFDLPAGAVIVLVQATAFTVALGTQR